MTSSTRPKKKKKRKILEAIVMYGLEKYGDEFERESIDCPYETRMGGHPAFMQEVSWFVYEWINPKTKKTILEEFVAEKLHNNPRQGALILRRKDIIYGEFEVVSTTTDYNGMRAMTMRAAQTQKEYTVISNDARLSYDTGTTLVGRIQPRDDHTYMICGVLSRPGELDGNLDAAAVADAAASGATSKDIMSAVHLMCSRAESRSGPGRDGNEIRDTTGMMKTIMGTNSQNPLAGLDPDMMREIISRSKREKMAFENAVSTPFVYTSSDTAEITLKSVLDRYPVSLLSMMCHELDIGSLPVADAMVSRLVHKIPHTVCESLYEMSRGEQRALAHVIYQGGLPFPGCMPELSKMMTDTSIGEDPNDPDFSIGFIHINTYHGILVMGTGMVDGSMQQMITVASDIRERILECQGWREFVKSDGRSGSVMSRFGHRRQF